MIPVIPEIQDFAFCPVGNRELSIKWGLPVAPNLPAIEEKSHQCYSCADQVCVQVEPSGVYMVGASVSVFWPLKPRLKCTDRWYFHFSVNLWKRLYVSVWLGVWLIVTAAPVLAFRLSDSTGTDDPITVQLILAARWLACHPFWYPHSDWLAGSACGI